MASSEKFKDDQKSLSSGLTRRQFLPLLGATAVAAAAPGILHAAPGGTPGKPSDALARFVYVGTYTAPDVPPGPTLTHLYSVNEDAAGRVSAYAINPATGALTFLNTATANGQFTTHIKVHPSGQYFYAANYGTGNFPVYLINANGSIGPKTDEFQSVGNGKGGFCARIANVVRGSSLRLSKQRALKRTGR